MITEHQRQGICRELLTEWFVEDRDRGLGLTWPEAVIAAGYNLDLHPEVLPLCADLVDAGWIVPREEDGAPVLNTEFPDELRFTITDAGKRTANEKS
jgi:hypothetical protein